MLLHTTLRVYIVSKIPVMICGYGTSILYHERGNTRKETSNDLAIAENVKYKNDQ